MIALRSVTYAFDDEPALEDVSVTVEDGEFVVLVGANGSGKTTLLRHCNGLVTPDDGEVIVDGLPVSEHVVEARTRVGMVFQHPRDQFVAATVRSDVAFGPENLGLDRAEIDRRVADALVAVNMDGRGAERIDTLSGGEQSRVAIAGALAMEPSHLLLDEPFAGLDEPSRQSVLDRLDALSADGVGVVVATHDLRDLLDRADRIVGMDAGRVVFDEPPAAAIERLESLRVRIPGGVRCSDRAPDRAGDGC